MSRSRANVEVESECRGRERICIDACFVLAGMRTGGVVHLDVLGRYQSV